MLIMEVIPPLINPPVILEESIGQAGFQAKQPCCFVAWRIFNQMILSEK
jgi:hypothetical protein